MYECMSLFSFSTMIKLLHYLLTFYFQLRLTENKSNVIENCAELSL